MKKRDPKSVTLDMGRALANGEIPNVRFARGDGGDDDGTRALVQGDKVLAQWNERDAPTLAWQLFMLFAAMRKVREAALAEAAAHTTRRGISAKGGAARKRANHAALEHAIAACLARGDKTSRYTTAWAVEYDYTEGRVREIIRGMKAKSRA